MVRITIQNVKRSRPEPHFATQEQLITEQRYIFCYLYYHHISHQMKVGRVL